MQFASGRLVLAFGANAGFARVAKLLDLIPEPWPPVPMADILRCFQGTKVPYNRVGLFYDMAV